MMDEVTVAVLREIRDEIRSTRTELSARIDQTNERLGHVEAGLLDLAEQQRFVVRWLETGTARDRHLEQDVRTLESRVDAIEARLPDRSG